MDLENLLKHLIKTIDYANSKISINICNDLDNKESITFELVDTDVNEVIESFKNPYVLNKVLEYLLENGLFDGFSISNY